jgi:YD repeat-containing protein
MSGNATNQDLAGQSNSFALTVMAMAMADYFRSRGWKDFIFLCVVVALGSAVKHYVWPPNDYARWKVRVIATPQLSISREPGQSGLLPCFFIVPRNAVNSPTLASFSVDDCLSLLPNGQRHDVFEISLVGGFLPIKTDLYVPDTIPLAFTRTYVPLNAWSERFQVYLPHVYDPFLTGSRFPYTLVNWQLPDGQTIHYDRISSGTGFADAIFGASSSDRIFANSRVNWNGWGWDWTLPDGATYLSPEAYNATRPQQGSLVGIFDENGNEVRLTRTASGDLTEIKSPQGHWIRFDYGQSHMIRAHDDLGNLVEYEYDASDRLRSVKYPDGHSTKYSYDSANRVIAVEDPAEDVAMEIKYDPDELVAEISTDTEHNYRFYYTLDKASKTLDAFVVEPHGKVIHVSIRDQKGGVAYSIQK